jgi:ribosome-associated protein
MVSNKTNHSDTPVIEEPSKSRSQIKREMKSLQKTGERLVELSHDQIRDIEMPEPLMEAVFLAKKTKAHGARKRQIQFIGSLMRKIDVTSINDALHEIDRGRSARDAEFHMIETWRDDLINGKETPIEEILEKFPEADRQRLRQLVRNARKEDHEKKPPHSSRALFRYIKKLADSDHE